MEEGMRDEALARGHAAPLREPRIVDQDGL